MQKVKFNKDFATYKKGSEVLLSRDLANMVLIKGVATRVKDKSTSKTSKSTKDKK